MPRKKSKRKHYAPPPGAIPKHPPPPPPKVHPAYNPESPPVSPYVCELAFEQINTYITFMLSAKSRLPCELVQLPKARRRTFVCGMMDACNSARIDANLDICDYEVPSYVTVMAVSWDELVEFEAGKSVLELDTITYMVSRIWRAVGRLKRDHNPLDFCVVDYDRSTSPFGMMVGVQVFLGVPVELGSCTSANFTLRPLAIGPITDNIVSHFLHLFTVKLGVDSDSDSDVETEPEPEPPTE